MLLPDANMMRMFSSRLNWDVSPNPLARLLAEKRARGARVLDLTEANPTGAGISYPAAILEALNSEEALHYQPSPRGLLSAREAVAAYYAERSRGVSPNRILLTASTSEAYAYLFKLLADPGDEVLTPRPSYPLFEYLAALESVSVRQYPLRYDGAWHLDFVELERAVSPRTRAVVVVNPNNPTGSFLKAEEWDRLQQLGIAILSDEVFSDYGFETASRMRGADRALTFTMSGLSKIAGLPQMKLGWIAVSGPGADEAMERLELIADTYLSVATPVQVALPELLALSENVREQIRTRTRANLDALRSLVAGSPVNVLNVEGGWSAILQVPRIRSEQDWALHLLGERDVLVQPGYFFDFESEAFLVVSLLTPRDVFEEGIRRVI
jgi:alanine-synthesizing transaminase